MGVVSSKLPIRLHKRKVRLNEDCPICLCEVEEKSLACGHKVHIDCLKMQIEHGNANEQDHLSFNFICCPLCRQILKSQKLKTLLKPIKKLKLTTDKLAISSLEKFAVDIFSEDPLKDIKKMKKHEKIELAYRKLVFYRCKGCSKPYCGGAVSCAQAAEQQSKKKKLVRRKKQAQNGVNPINADQQQIVIPIPPIPPPFVVNPFYAPPQNEIPLPPPPPPFLVNNDLYVPLYPFLYSKNKQNIPDHNNNNSEIIDNIQLEVGDDEEYFDFFALFSDIVNPLPVVNNHIDVPLLCSVKLEEEIEKKEEEEEYFDSPLYILFSAIPIPPPPPPFIVNKFYLNNQNNDVNQMNNALRNSRADVIELENINNINNNIKEVDDSESESEYEEIEEEVDDDEENDGGEVDREGRYCFDCSAVKIKKDCEHPVTDLIFKCNSCCSPATFHCGGAYFFCDPCHNGAPYQLCEGPDKCPLGVAHPANDLRMHGTPVPFVIGCGHCGPVRREFGDPYNDYSVFSYLASY